MSFFVCRAQPAPPTAPDPDLAVKEVVLEALDTFGKQSGNSAAQAQLLRLRFLDGRTAYSVANSLNLTENIVYKRQRLAIQALAAVIWQAEEAALAEREACIAARLEIQEPPRLFGVAGKLAGLVEMLTSQDSPWLVAVVGIGGIGKTSLADAAVRKIVRMPAFADVAWVSARRGRFTLWNGLLEHCEGRPALTFEALLDAIVEQLGFQDLTQLPLDQKQAGVSARFKACPHLWW